MCCYLHLILSLLILYCFNYFTFSFSFLCSVSWSSFLFSMYILNIFYSFSSNSLLFLSSNLNFWRKVRKLSKLHNLKEKCSHEIIRRLLLGRKVMTNLDSILKSRHITLPKNVCLVKAMLFPMVMYGCECWILKKAEHQRIDVFELWCWRRLLRVPWTAMRSNQSILKEISPEYSLEGLMLKMKLQYFRHLMKRTDSLQKILMLWKI